MNKILFLFFLILLGLKNNAQIPAQTLPDFTFFKVDKTPFTNNSLEKAGNLFFVFFDTQCEHCQRAISFINKHLKEFKKTSIYLITLDDEKLFSVFIDKFGKNLKNKKNVILLQDRQYQFINKFHPRKYPSMYLYSVERKLIDYEDNDQSVFRFIKLINEHQ